MSIAWIIIASLSAAVLAYLAGQTVYGHFIKYGWYALAMKVRPGRVVRKVTSQEELRTKAIAAGVHRPDLLQEALVVKQYFMVATFVFFLLLTYSRDWFTALLMSMPLAYAALRGPEFYFQQLSKRRQVRAARDLPRLIEALLLYVRSGLNLEAAFRELAQRFSGFWKNDLNILVLNLDGGMPFKEALGKFAARFSSLEVSRFTEALEQSRVLGVPLSQSLTVHVDLMRAKRRYRAQELARTAAVKISLPLVFFIFPALLIIFLAPAILQIMEVLQ